MAELGMPSYILHNWRSFCAFVWFSFFLILSSFIFKDSETSSQCYVYASRDESSKGSDPSTIDGIIETEKKSSALLTLVQEEKYKKKMENQLINGNVLTTDTHIDEYEDIVSTVAALVPGSHGDGSLAFDPNSERRFPTVTDKGTDQNVAGTLIYEAARENINNRKVEEDQKKEEQYFTALAEDSYLGYDLSRDHRSKQEAEQRQSDDRVHILSKANIKDMDRPTQDLSRPIKLPKFFEEDFEYSDLLRISIDAKENKKKDSKEVAETSKEKPKKNKDTEKEGSKKGQTLSEKKKQKEEKKKEFDLLSVMKMNVEAARKDSLTLSTDIKRYGRSAVRLELLASDEEAYDGHRVELTHDNDDGASTIGYYAFSFLIPEEGGLVDDKRDTGPAKNLGELPKFDHKDYQYIMQFHDQPRKGQSWDNFPKHNSSVALYYINKSIGLNVKLNARKGEYQFGPLPIQLGRWNDVVMQIGWSRGRDGFIRAWINGQSIITKDTSNTNDIYYLGRNLYYGNSAYLKLGLYRSPNIKKDSAIYFDEVRIGASLEDISQARVTTLSSLSSHLPHLERYQEDSKEDRLNRQRNTLSVDRHVEDNESNMIMSQQGIPDFPKISEEQEHRKLRREGKQSVKDYLE